MLHPKLGPVHLALLCALLPAILSCQQGADAVGGTRDQERIYTVADLDDIVLQAREAPQGTELRDDASGPYDLEEFWPSACCLGLQAQFDDAGFQTAHVTLLEQPGHSDDPIDTRPGWEQVNSSAVLFLTDEGAAEGMDAWVDYYRAPVLEPVDVRGLGEQAVGLAGSPTAPAEKLVLYFWRHGRLVLSLRASTGTGTVSVTQVRQLVDRMDLRSR